MIPPRWCSCGYRAVAPMMLEMSTLKSVAPPNSPSAADIFTAARHAEGTVKGMSGEEMFKYLLYIPGNKGDQLYTCRLDHRSWSF